MTQIITARYNGRCSRCGRPVRAGEQVEWDAASRTVRHPQCSRANAPAASGTPAREPLAGVAGGARIPQGRNRKPGSCESCGEYLQPGEGRLQYCVEDSGCPKHHDYSGYHLYCADEAQCKKNKTEAKASAAAARKAKIQAALSGLEALTAPIKTWYHEGEYLSGLQVSGPAAELMAALGLCQYVSAWGYHVDARVVEALGQEFTGAQAAEYAHLAERGTR